MNCNNPFVGNKPKAGTYWEKVPTLQIAYDLGAQEQREFLLASPLALPGEVATECVGGPDVITVSILTFNHLNTAKVKGTWVFIPDEECK